jgi:hypothetical protein
MRRWFFVLLILLLPLRGWVGDAMAVQMALPGQQVPANVAMQHADSDLHAAHSHSHSHSSTIATAATDDCGGHTMAQVHGDEMDSAHCGSCTMCQTCHSVAVLQPSDLLVTTQVSPTSPRAGLQVFASAERALLLKPPIH